MILPYILTVNLNYFDKIKMAPAGGIRPLEALALVGKGVLSRLSHCSSVMYKSVTYH